LIVDKKDSRIDFSFTFLVLTFLASIIVASIAKSHGHGSVATGLACCAIVTIVAAKVRWELKTEWWFWAALFLGIGLQIPMVLFLPWDEPYLTGAGGLGLSIPGFILISGCIWLAEKIFSKSALPK
jgi:peptidoglycan/LPS O-acetylase OafA/YrhL